MIGEDGRMNERAGERVRRPDRARGARGGRRAAARGGRDRPHRALHARRAVLAPLGRADRAADLPAVVHEDGGARRARDRRGGGRPPARAPREPAQALPRLARGHPALVHLAAALVGPPDPRLVPRGGDLRRHGAARGRRLGARPRRARHVVLVRPVAVRHARLARRHARAARVLPDRRALDGPRHPLPLGRADGHARDRVHRRGPVLRRLQPLDDPRPRRAPDVQVARHGHRPARGDRPARRRRHALRPARDVLHAGRALLRGEGRAGPPARQQALQRVAARAAARGAGRRAARRPAAAGRRRGRLDPLAAAARQGRHGARDRGVRVPPRRARALRLRLRRAVRLVPGDRQAAPVRRRQRGGQRLRARRAGRDAGHRAPRDPVRDRGAVVAPAGRRGAADGAPLAAARRRAARPGGRGGGRRARSPPCRSCAAGATGSARRRRPCCRRGSRPRATSAPPSTSRGSPGSSGRATARPPPRSRCRAGPSRSCPPTPSTSAPPRAGSRSAAAGSTRRSRARRRSWRTRASSPRRPRRSCRPSATKLARLREERDGL